MSSFYGKGVNVESQEEFILHVLNGQSHVTNEERAFWNDKVTVVFDTQNHSLIFSKTAIEQENND